MVVGDRVVVYLGPAEASDRTLTFMEQESVRIEPRFGELLDEHLLVPVALFGMVGERTSVDLEPRRIVDARSKRSGDESLRHTMIGGERQRTSHMEQWCVGPQPVAFGTRYLGIGGFEHEPSNRATTGRADGV